MVLQVLSLRGSACIYCDGQNGEDLFELEFWFQTEQFWFFIDIVLF